MLRPTPLGGLVAAWVSLCRGAACEPSNGRNRERMKNTLRTRVARLGGVSGTPVSGLSGWHRVVVRPSSYVGGGLVLGFLLSAAGNCADPNNLISNPDFELGNTGFSSDYTYTAIPTAGEAMYSVVPSAHDVHGAWTTAPDHTAVGVNYFVANGSADNSLAVWYTTDPILVSQPDTAYRFEAYLTSVYTVTAADSPILTFQVGNGTDWFDMGTSLTFPPGYTPGQWRLSYYDGVFSTPGTYYLRLLNAQTALGGNDLGVDDLYFGLSAAAPSAGENPPPPPAELPSVSVPPVAPVPEPSTWVSSLVMLAAAGSWVFRCRQRGICMTRQ